MQLYTVPQCSAFVCDDNIVFESCLGSDKCCLGHGHIGEQVVKISETKQVSLVVTIAPRVLVLLVTNINGHVLHLIHIRVHLCTMHLEELSSVMQLVPLNTAQLNSVRQLVSLSYHVFNPSRTN